MSPTGLVVGTGLEKSLPMRSGRAGASLSGTVVLLEALGRMPRIPSLDMHFRTRQGVVPARRPYLGSPVSFDQALRKPKRLSLASHVSVMASLGGPLDPPRCRPPSATGRTPTCSRPAPAPSSRRC
jgi:hypothetical protein